MLFRSHDVVFNINPKKGRTKHETGIKVLDESLFGDIKVPRVKGINGFRFVRWTPKLPKNNTEVTKDMEFTALFKDIERPKVRIIEPKHKDVVDPDELMVTVRATDNNRLSKLIVKLYRVGKKHPVETKVIKLNGKFYEDDIDFTNLFKIRDGKYYVTAQAVDRAGLS